MALVKDNPRYALRVEGESMRIAGIHPGEWVLVNPDADIIDGHIYVVRIRGEISLKRVYRNGGQLRLVNGQGVMEMVGPERVESLGEVELHGHWTAPRSA